MDFVAIASAGYPCRGELVPNRLEPDTVRAVGLGTEPAVAIFLVVFVIALEPRDSAVTLECEDVRRDAVEEPAIMRDHDGAAGEVEQGFFERTQRLDVEVVGRFVEHQQVAARAQHLGEVDAVALAAR